MHWVAVALLGALVAFSLVSIEAASQVLIGLKDWIIAFFDWLFVGVVGLTLVVVAFLGVYPAANVRLGPEDSEPEFSTLSLVPMYHLPYAELDFVDLPLTHHQ